MMYSNRFVAVIKCGGKILREVNKENDVILPFGAEYSLLLKNLDTRRAVVNVDIDGQDMLEGCRLVIDAGEETELEGKMIDGKVRNKFKFIQKTEKIQGHRGDKIDDGIVRIKFGFERKQKVYPTMYRNFDLHSRGITGQSVGGGHSNAFYGSRGGEPMAKGNISHSVESNVTMDSLAPQAEEGITVAGSETKQDFSTTTVGTIEDHDVIILRLRGTDTKGEPAQVALTVKSKVQCPTCGTTSKAGTNYCPDCGTNIQV